MGDWDRGRSPRYQRQHQQQQKQGGGSHGGWKAAKASSSPSSSKSWKPPTSGCWKPTVPAWEKQFCYHVGSIPWRKLCECKPLLPLYKSVADWDDSACEEVFHGAKARYWATINGFSCDIPLPDPDIYIDKINWEERIDDELVLDLDRRTYEEKEMNEKNSSSYLITGWDTFLVPDCDGWGDVDKKEDCDGKSGSHHCPVEESWENFGLDHLVKNNRSSCSRG